MFSVDQLNLLKDFALKSDFLFEKGVITTDSFTGEIGEFIACQHFKLSKSDRCTKSVDGIDQFGRKYQIKSKVTNNNRYSFNAKGLEIADFDFLVIVFFDINYKPLKMIKIASDNIENNHFKLNRTNLSQFETINESEIKIEGDVKKLILDFANSFNNLMTSGIINSRKIVGDIGEFYACHFLNLIKCSSSIQKGIDAKHPNGLTFEIKTRRVYQSGRRRSETRRLNNLVNKTADYVVVVAIDHSFDCAGMWIVPFNNIVNPKSATLKIVNSTVGVLNVVPSRIPWLKTGEKFINF